MGGGCDDGEVGGWITGSPGDEPDSALGLGGERAGGALIGDGPVVDHHDVWAGLHNVVDDVGRQQHSPASGQGGEKVAESEPLFGVKPRGRFVDDEQARVVEDGLGNPDPAFHATGVGFELPGGGTVEGDQLEDFAHTGRSTVPVGDAFEYGQVVEELAGVEVGVEAELLGQVAERGLN
jgi:hypothetical protein